MRRTASSLLSCTILVATLHATAVPREAVAQAVPRPVSPRRWTVAPEVGAWWQEASSREVRNGPGVLVGLRIARALQPQVYLSAAAGYMRLDNSRTIVMQASETETRTEYYRAEMVPLSLGVEWLAGFGRTTAAVGVDAGVAYWREPIDHVIGPTYFGNPSSDDWSPHALLGGHVGVRHALGDRVALRGTLGGLLGGSFTRRALTTTLGLAWQL